MGQQHANVHPDAPAKSGSLRESLCHAKYAIMKFL
jgi:hypothetical protein